MVWFARAFAAALAWAAPLAASAQDYPCWLNRDGQFAFDAQGNRRSVVSPDPVSSRTWAQLGAANDPAAIQAMVGTWYSEGRSSDGQSIQYIYSSFDANGLFQYRDKTCGPTGLCSQNQGTGEFRANFPGDGTLFYMVNFSDLMKEHQCVSNNVTAQGPGVLRGRGGGLLRRVP